MLNGGRDRTNKDRLPAVGILQGSSLPGWITDQPRTQRTDPVQLRLFAILIGSALDDLQGEIKRTGPNQHPCSNPWHSNIMFAVDQVDQVDQKIKYGTIHIDILDQPVRSCLYCIKPNQPVLLYHKNIKSKSFCKKRKNDIDEKIIMRYTIITSRRKMVKIIFITQS